MPHTMPLTMQRALPLTLILALSSAVAFAAPTATPAQADKLSKATTLAAEAQDLAKRKACLNCHGIDRKVIGPALRDVAKRYRGKKDAERMLTAKVLNGGQGAWGPVAMPANRQVDEAQARQLVRWVLTLK